MALSTLPAELTDLVIDHLQDDAQSLQACALVAHAWVARSQFYLFQAVDLRSPWQAKPLLKSLQHEPLLAARVRRLCVNEDSRAWLKDNRATVEPLFKLLSDTVETLYSLGSVDVFGLDFGDPVAPLPRVTTITITLSGLEKETSRDCIPLEHALHRFPQLKKLYISAWAVRGRFWKSAGQQIELASLHLGTTEESLQRSIFSRTSVWTLTRFSFDLAFPVRSTDAIFNFLPTLPLLQHLRLGHFTGGEKIPNTEFPARGLILHRDACLQSLYIDGLGTVSDEHRLFFLLETSALRSTSILTLATTRAPSFAWRRLQDLCETAFDNLLSLHLMANNLKRGASGTNKEPSFSNEESNLIRTRMSRLDTKGIIHFSPYLHARDYFER